MNNTLRNRGSRHARRTRVPRLALLALGSIVGIATIITACSDDDTTTPPISNEASTSDQATTPFDASVSDTSIADAADASDAMVCLGATDAAGLDDATVQAGRDLVLAFKCAGCHQPTPAADSGLYLSGGNPFFDATVFSANLTPDPVNGLGCWTDPQIINAVLNGIDDQDASLCAPMPKFGAKVDGGDPRMDAGAALAITTFLRSLKPDPKEIKASVCPIVDAGADH